MRVTTGTRWQHKEFASMTMTVVAVSFLSSRVTCKCSDGVTRELRSSDVLATYSLIDSDEHAADDAEQV